MGYGLIKKLFRIFKEPLPARIVRVEHVPSFIDLNGEIVSNGRVKRHLPCDNHRAEIGCDEIKNPMGDEWVLTL